MPRRLSLVPLFLLLLAMSLLAACSARADRSGQNEPVSATPAPPSAPGESPLHAARLDLAQRLNVSPLDVHLTRLQHAGWDGCLGVKVEGRACTMLFIGGLIAWFDVGGKEYRYHIGGAQFVAASFADGTLEDGAPVPPEIRADLGAVLGDYARWDLALRLNVSEDSVVTMAIAPVVFPSLCLGFERPDIVCAEMLAPGFIILLQAGGKEYRYHVSEHGFIATDFERGQRTIDPPSDTVDVQRKMREDLALRLDVEVQRVGVYSFRLVTWRDGCLGVHYPGQACTTALVDGFLAELVAPDGRLFRYHGAGNSFRAASFDEQAGATLQQPLLSEE